MFFISSSDINSIYIKLYYCYTLDVCINPKLQY